MKTNEVAATWWADELRKVIPKEEYKKIEVFEELLAEAIKKFLEKSQIMYLSSDKKPEYIIKIFAEKAGLDEMNVFPEKAIMVVDAMTVKVMTEDKHFKTIPS